MSELQEATAQKRQWTEEQLRRGDTIIGWPSDGLEQGRKCSRNKLRQY